MKLIPIPCGMSKGTNCANTNECVFKTTNGKCVLALNSELENCVHNINGNCEVFSDEIIQQPCIKSPCTYYADLKELTSICPLCKLHNSLGCPYGYIPDNKECDEFQPKRGKSK